MINVPEVFGSMVFNDAIMKEKLPKDVYKSLHKTIEDGLELDINVANVVASAMRDWAIEKGATHYTHWFQPMTGITAEKHDSFISPQSDGRVIMEFSGKELIKGEPDASSFPSGGLRATFEARGYTAWDPTSYAFIKDDALCIPTAFCSYGGEVLDKKTPLLRSMELISDEALRILHLFGDTTATRVASTVGPEQEYFLIDKEVYEARKDLVYTGRTLFGAKSPKGQELEDHYFGAIKPRVMDFMKELNEELWKLGIYAKTEHNEVAPAQHELAPIFSTTNIATDHNQLTMEIMKKVAAKHGMACLLHEKPFAGVNGSGKHNNWSLSTNTGLNLFEPGKTPADNKQFLLFLCAVIKAIDEHQDLLRISVASAGNDHRLGANEAPPAIISTFLGSDLAGILESIENGTKYNGSPAATMVTGVHVLPDFKKDTIKKHKRIIFNGNNYAKEWVVEAEKRGLLNLKTTADALPLFVSSKNIQLFTKHKIFTEAEIRSRCELLLENYCKVLNIEALTLLVGLFSTTEGLFYGHGFRALGVQALGVVSVMAWSAAASFITFKILDKTVGLRCSAHEEIAGLDSSEHGISSSYADFMPVIPTILGSSAADTGVVGDNADVIGKVDIDASVPVEIKTPKNAISSDVKITRLDVIMKQAKFEEFKEAMNSIGVTGMTVTQVLGCGMQKGQSEFYRGVAVDMTLLPKVLVEIVVCKVPVRTVIGAAKKVLYTGHIGDGKIFVYDVENVIKVRTGEEGFDALQD